MPVPVAGDVKRVHGHAWRHRSRGIGSARPRPCLLAGDDDHAVAPAELPADGVGRVRAAERTHRLGDPQQRGTPLDGHNPADRAELDEVGPAGGRRASAAPNTAAASARVTAPHPDSGSDIEPDRPTSTRVRPGSAGTDASEACSAFSSTRLHRSDGAAR